MLVFNQEFVEFLLGIVEIPLVVKIFRKLFMQRIFSDKEMAGRTSSLSKVAKNKQVQKVVFPKPFGSR